MQDLAFTPLVSFAVRYGSLHATSNEPILFEAGESYTLDLPMVTPRTQH